MRRNATKALHLAVGACAVQGDGLDWACQQDHKARAVAREADDAGGENKRVPPSPIDSLVRRVAEDQAVAEWIKDDHVSGAPRHRLDAGMVITVRFYIEPLAVFIDAGDLNAHR